MKVDTVIRTAFVCGATCFVVWRMTPMIDRLGTLGDGLDVAALLSRHAAEPPPSTPQVVGNGLVVYSPNGESLTEDERQRLLAAATRMRPRMRDARVSMPGHDLPGAPSDAPETTDIEQLIDSEAVQAVIDQLQSDQ